MQLELVRFLEPLYNAETHEMIGDFHSHCPLRVVDIREMVVFFGYFLSLSQHFFVVEFAIVSTFEVQHPRMDFLAVRPHKEQVIDIIQHLKMFSPKGSLDWQDTMTVSRNELPLIIDILHDSTDHPHWVHLHISWIDFDKAEALHPEHGTLTWV